ncbi:MAG: NAD(P)-dependent glycerol-3-phosphate dehydrogenase [Calditerrivibrio sp.]|nr:NAD(P)-dependent glycerol-3-phosphate dehydrogenase [Calditerrivibrio sp.]
MQEKIAVIGGGSWGTALANLLSENGNYTTLFVREVEIVDSVNSYHINSLFFPDIELNHSLKAEPFSALHGIKDCFNFVWVVPTQFTRSSLKEFKDILSGKRIIIATKGIEIGTGELVVDIFRDNLSADLSIISGPSFAREVILKKPTAVSVGGKNKDSTTFWQKIFSNGYFRVYRTDDMVGLELGGALKNVIAIAVGISDGLGFGNNARAGLITRGLAEITRTGLKMGASLETFMGLSGMGDLVLTCTGELSRNRQVGLEIAKGKTIEEIQKDMKMVAEGVFTAKAANELAQKIGVEMPIVSEVYKVIYEGKSPYRSVLDLMKRPLKDEKFS